MSSTESGMIVRALDQLYAAGMRDGMCWRAIGTDEDRAGAEILEQMMRESGFSVRRDEVGNLIGRLEGETSETVMVGSHRDTVKNGGRYDGAFGAVSAIVAVSSLYAELGTPQKSVEVVALTEEEGSRFPSGYVGSRALAGMLSENDFAETDQSGNTLREVLLASGFSAVAAKGRSDITHFTEIHIEQGGVLEKEGLDVGVVSSIAGLLLGRATVYGQQNHAGTTPMALRKDPIPELAGLICTMTDWARQKREGAVATFGWIDVSPGNSNVIPSKASVSIDIRSGDPEALREAKAMLDTWRSSCPLRAELLYSAQDEPTPMDSAGADTLCDLAGRLGLRYKKMTSGAGHDSQIMAAVSAANMIFVPSAGGVSHTPDEYTSPEQLEKGYRLLKEYISLLAWSKKEEESE